MKFLLDMGISIRVAEWLIAEGHDALNLSEENLHELPDVYILRKAHDEERILLTADMDFGTLLIHHKSYITSVIQFRVTDFKAENIIAKLSTVFQNLADHDPNAKFLITVEDKRIRYRTISTV